MNKNADDENITDLRALPAVSSVLARPAVVVAIRNYGLAAVTRAVREVIDEARSALLQDGVTRVRDADVDARARSLARGTLVPVINATGVIIHTNLGRAPLAREALDAVVAIGSGYASLELDLDEGGRGHRHLHARDLLVELTGAEDAIVVNNNAGAVLLALAAGAAGREVIVSRGELVEIGGGFRIPDVLAQSGATLVEVGTTNRTHLSDYERAISPNTALLLKVHRSNFAMVGFTAEVSPRDLATLARDHRLPFVYDAGSGCVDQGAPDEPSVRSVVAAGADVVMFSGDKMLGGPQAGIIVGRSELLEPMRRHPWMRALRPDKLCLAALVATLRLWRDEPSRIPVVYYGSIEAPELEARARALAERSAGRVEPVATTARVGGGAAPTHEIPSWGLRAATSNADGLASRLRDGQPAIVARIEDGAVILDLRCIPVDDDDVLLAAIARATDG